MKKYLVLALTVLMMLCVAMPALADRDFQFADETVNVFEGETLKLNLLMQGECAGAEVTYRSGNMKAATVDENGVITAVAKGTARVTATCTVGKKTHTATVNVNVQRAVTSIEVTNTDRWTIFEADDERLVGLVDEENELPVIVMVPKKQLNVSTAMQPRDASTTRAVLTVQQEGEVEVLRVSDNTVTARNPGTALLTIASKSNPEVNVQYLVLVCEPVTALTIDGQKTIFEGDQTQLGVTYTPANATLKDVVWTSSDPRIAAVDEFGVVTALKRGDVTINAKATDGSNVSGNFRMTVSVRPTGVTLKNNNVLLNVGAKTNLTAVVEPSNVSDKSVEWTSSDMSVATVNANGSVTGVSVGTCTITCTSKIASDIYTTAEVTVVQPVTSITLDGDKNLFVDEQEQLYATVAPANATIQDLTWSSSDPRIATVDAYGVVTGLKRGEVSITAKATDGSNVSRRFTINVTVRPTDIQLKQNSLIVKVKGKGTLSATVLPSSVSDKNVEWYSSDPDVATVNSNGTVTGVSVGTCTITCVSRIAPDVQTYATITVVQPVTKITSHTKSVSVVVRESAHTAWDIQPANATIQDLTYKSSNTKIATVDANGIVTGVKAGECYITATSVDGSNISGRVKVTVIQPVEGVHMKSDYYEVGVGDRLTITAVLEPSDATNKNMSWSIADSSIATVNGTSNKPTVRGVAWGDTVIFGYTEDGGYMTNCSLHVGDYNKALIMTDLYVSGNAPKIAVRNESNMNVTRFMFEIELYDMNDFPLNCNSGHSNILYGSYNHTLYPGSSTQHGRFTFNDYNQPIEQIGRMVMRITSYTCDDGFRYNIKKEKQVTLEYTAPGWAPFQEDPGEEEGGILTPEE